MYAQHALSAPYTYMTSAFPVFFGAAYHANIIGCGIIISRRTLFNKSRPSPRGISAGVTETDSGEYFDLQKISVRKIKQTE